jgi:hypothetical protein
MCHFEWKKQEFSGLNAQLIRSIIDHHFNIRIHELAVSLLSLFFYLMGRKIKIVSARVPHTTSFDKTRVKK